MITTSNISPLGWQAILPAEYARIAYVDIVKLFTHDSTITTNALDVELDAQFVYNGYEAAGSNLLKSTAIDGWVFGTSRVEYFIVSYMTVGLRMVNDSCNREYFPSGGLNPPNKVVSNYHGKIPSYTTRKQVHIHDCGYDMNGKFYQFEPSAIVNNEDWGKMIFGSAPTASKGNHWRIWRCTVRQNGVMTADLIPCMRIEDGCPGLWCNVYKKFYEQSPAATLDLDSDVDNGVFYVNPEQAPEEEPA